MSLLALVVFSSCSAGLPDLSLRVLMRLLCDLIMRSLPSVHQPCDCNSKNVNYLAVISLVLFSLNFRVRLPHLSKLKTCLVTVSSGI